MGRKLLRGLVVSCLALASLIFVTSTNLEVNQCEDTAHEDIVKNDAADGWEQYFS